jgi:Interferon-induced transmembrane protein
MSDPYRSSAPAEPGLWLGLSIGATLVCCLPLGVVGIIFAAMAMDANNKGDYYLAQERTRQAKTWTLWSFGVGLGVIVLYVVCAAGGGLLTQVGR